MRNIEWKSGFYQCACDEKSEFQADVLCGNDKESPDYFFKIHKNYINSSSYLILEIYYWGHVIEFKCFSTVEEAQEYAANYHYHI